MPRLPVDAAREIADGEAGHEHAERARIGRETHLPRRHAVMLGEHGQDGLRGEEIDEAQERRERDDDGAEEHACRVTMGLALGGGNRVTDVRHGLGSSIDAGAGRDVPGRRAERHVQGVRRGGLTCCGLFRPSRGRRRAARRSCRRDSSTNATRRGSRPRRRRRHAPAARSNCSHIRGSRLRRCR